MPPKLVVYGDLAVDLFVQVDSMPGVGQDAIVHHLAFLPAGSAANCAVTAARLGATVEFVGLTGHDHLTPILLEDLRTSQVRYGHLRQVEGPTAVIVAVVDQQGERTFYSYRGVSSWTAYGPLPPELLAPGDWLHLSGYSFQDEYSQATALAFIAQAEARGAHITLDPSFHFAREFRTRYASLLPALDFVFPNREEAYLMSGATDPEQAAAIIRTFGVKTVVMKLGSQGCLIASAEGNCYVPAYPAAQVVDTTGAGDAFCAGFLTGQLWGLAASASAKIGHGAAVCVIGQLGGHAGSPTLPQLLAHLTANGDAELAAVLRSLSLAV